MAKRPKSRNSRSSYSSNGSALLKNDALVYKIVIAVLLMCIVGLLYGIGAWLMSSSPKEKLTNGSKTIAVTYSEDQKQWSYIQALESRMVNGKPQAVRVENKNVSKSKAQDNSKKIATANKIVENKVSDNKATNSKNNKASNKKTTSTKKTGTKSNNSKTRAKKSTTSKKTETRKPAPVEKPKDIKKTTSNKDIWSAIEK